MTLAVIGSLFTAAVSVSVHMRTSQYLAFYERLSVLGLVRTVLDSPASYNAAVAMNIDELPRCGNESKPTAMLQCDETGNLVAIDIDFAFLQEAFGSGVTQRRLGWLDSLVVPMLVSATIRRAHPLFFVMPYDGRIFRTHRVFDSLAPDISFTADSFTSDNIFMRNVTFGALPSTRDNVVRVGNNCTFIDVLLPCPVPPVFYRCYGLTVNDTSPPCLSAAVSLPPPALPTASEYGSNVTRAGVVATNVLNETAAVIEQCAVEMYECPLEARSRNSACLPALLCANCFQGVCFGEVYKPATIGINTIDAGFQHVLWAQEVRVYFGPSAGLTTKIELFDVDNRTWHTVFSRPKPDRAEERPNQLNFDAIRVAPHKTNRVRVTFETALPVDGLDAIHLVGSLIPVPFVVPQPFAMRCAAPFSLNERSMLDETRGDSYCIDRVCQDWCANANDAAVFNATVIGRFLVLVGGEWSGQTAVAEPSDGTLVYALEGNNAVSSVNVTWSGGTPARFVRLVGEPVPSNSSGGSVVVKLPAATNIPLAVESGRPLEGVLVRRFKRVYELLPAAQNASEVTVANATFGWRDGELLELVAGSGWRVVTTARLTRLIVNAGTSSSRRLLTSVGERLLVVVSSVVTPQHDGTVNRALVGKRVEQTAIDVFDVVHGVWFTNVAQHHAGGATVDELRVESRANQFAVVDRNGSASVFEWRAGNVSFVACESNGECGTCLTNERNYEACAWCSDGRRCVVAGVFQCNVGVAPIRSSTQCPAVMTTSTSASMQSSSSTTSDMISSSVSVEVTTTTATTVESIVVTSTTSAIASNSGVNIAAAVAIPIVLVLLIGIAVAVVVILRRRRRRKRDAEPAEANKDVELRGPLKSANGAYDVVALPSFCVREGMRIDAAELEMGDELGAGAFGIDESAVAQH